MLAILTGWLSGVSGPALVVVAIASSVPSAPNGYMLARQMGGDAPLLARILTAQIVFALFSIPAALAAAAIWRPDARSRKAARGFRIRSCGQKRKRRA